MKELLSERTVIVRVWKSAGQSHCGRAVERHICGGVIGQELSGSQTFSFLLLLR